MYTNFFFFDIETTSKYGDFNTLKLNDPRGAELFIKKCDRMADFDEWKGKTVEELYVTKSPLLAEHGKIICLSFGMFKDSTSDTPIIRTLINDKEEVLMTEIKQLFDKVGKSGKRICGYNVKNFDVPWIIRKLYKYDLEIPSIINVIDKKPWETGIIDLYSYFVKYTSMDEVAYDLGIESSKNNLDGSKVHEYYWIKRDNQSIMNYCEQDVRVLVDISRKIKL